MTNKEFVEKAKDIATNYKTLYVMGCFGAPMNEANKKRYTSNYAYNKKASRSKLINAASADTFGFDCVCLIKGILWGWNGNKTKTYGGASYTSNGVADFGTENMKNYCSSWSKDFKNIEVGEVLYMKGHAGIYIGEGLAVECTPSWENKVQITAVKNIGTKSGYKSRKWTSHGKLKYIDYKKIEIEQPKEEIKTNSDFFDGKGCFKLGDKHPNIGKVATFMRKTFPAYTKKEALGNLYGKYIQASIKEFQKRTGLKQTGNIDKNTLSELKKYGFKEN